MSSNSLMFFFLTGGPALLQSVLAYLPLTEADKQRMVVKFRGGHARNS